MTFSPVTLALAALCGILLAGGIMLAVVAVTRRPVRLGDAIALLSGESPVAAVDVPDEDSRLGAWAYRTIRLPVSARAQRTLHLRGESIATFYTDKVVYALIGLVAPSLLATAAAVLFGVSWTVPVLAGLIGGVAGFLVPDLLLYRSGEGVKADAGEALFTFFDLITLERLANQSATHALHAAAALSDGVLFRQIRGALERARLEQQTPYAELRRLADELELPELRDVADVMRLDEQGAALAGTLRARVKERRDVHLTRQKIAAHAVSERMTIFMVLPALVFALIFLTPPLLRLVLPP